MYCKSHGKCVVEVKCPYNIQNSTIADGLNQCEFLTSTDGKTTLKTSHKYYTQITSQIVLSHSSHGYFVVWTTKDTFIQKRELNIKLWSAVSTNLEIFFKSYVAERLLGINPIEFCGT